MLQLGVYYLCIKVIDSETVRDRATKKKEKQKKEKKRLRIGINSIHPSTKNIYL